MDAGASANGNYDIQFTLKKALTAGATVGTVMAVSPVSAANGIFTVTLDFGSAPSNGSDEASTGGTYSLSDGFFGQYMALQQTGAPQVTI